MLPQESKAQLLDAPSNATWVNNGESQAFQGVAVFTPETAIATMAVSRLTGFVITTAGNVILTLVASPNMPTLPFAVPLGSGIAGIFWSLK